MKISRFKILKFASIVVIIMFSMYAQYQEVISSIKAGMPTQIIIITLIQINTFLYIPIFLILIALKLRYNNGPFLKHITISTFGDALLLNIALIGQFIISFKDDFLWISYISSLGLLIIAWIVLKLISYKEHIKNWNLHC